MPDRPDRFAQPVLLTPDAPATGSTSTHRDDVLAQVAAEARDLADRPIEEAVTWASRLGSVTPDPASGETLLRWELLATVAAQDLTVARVVEPHLDALAILHEHGDEVPDATSWGVYAAEGPAPRLEATRTSDGWMLSGRKPWCSLAGHLSHALVTAWVDPERRGLFAIDLADEKVSFEDGTWAPRGLTSVVSTALMMDGVAGREIGGAGWYLVREGFAWGGIGVAAVWYGGAVAVARRLHAQLCVREPDQIALMHLGVVDAALTSARAVLREAAAAADVGVAGGHPAALLAARARHVVTATCETVLSEVAHALGPGPLSQEPGHARRVADLSLYLRQHHAARDSAASGRLLAQGFGTAPPW